MTLKGGDHWARAVECGLATQNLRTERIDGSGGGVMDEVEERRDLNAFNKHFHLLLLSRLKRPGSAEPRDRAGARVEKRAPSLSFHKTHNCKNKYSGHVLYLLTTIRPLQHLFD